MYDDLLSCKDRHRIFQQNFSTRYELHLFQQPLHDEQSRHERLFSSVQGIRIIDVADERADIFCCESQADISCRNAFGAGFEA